MEQLELTFRANNQCLEATNFTPPLFVASNTVDWIMAKFDLGTNWDCWSLGAVKAIWKFKGQQYSAILNAEGECTVPHEVLGAMTGEVKVNLVASTIEDDEVVERLTTYPLYCINVNKVALIDGDNSVAITPSEYEQFVEDVQEYAQDAYDAKIGAEQAADSASSSAGIASDMADTATQAKDVAVQQAQLAVDAKEAAQTAQGLAESAKDSAVNAKEDAESARDSAIEAKNDAQGYAQDAEEASQSILGLQATAEVDANVGTPSVNVSVSEVGGNKVMDFDFHNLKGVQGETGANGEDGADGFSPTVEVTPTEDGNEVTITDKNGEHTFEVLNGNIEDFYPFLPTDTASGTIASFPDGADGIPMSSVKASINPIQDLHGQDSPYPAGGGKNKLDISAVDIKKWQLVSNAFKAREDSYQYINFTVNPNDESVTVVLSGTYMGICIDIPSGAVARVFSQDGTAANGVYLYSAYEDGATRLNNSAKSCSIPAETSGCAALLFYTAGTYTVKLQLEEGSTATDWTPYSNICPISGTDEVEVVRAGKNLLDKNNAVALNDCWLKTTTNTIASGGGNRGVIIPIVGGATYTLSVQAKNATDLQVASFVDVPVVGSVCIDKATASSAVTAKTVTIATYANAKYLFVKYNNTNTTQTYTTEQVLDGLMLEAGTTATTYEPYITPLTITTALGQTVYGGKLDWHCFLWLN